MSKQEFLEQLKKGLSGLPENDIEEQLDFYSEMIDDRIEEGLAEEDAVSKIGNIDEIIQTVLADIPLSKLVKEKIKPKRKLRVWEILLIALGFPVWFPLLLAIFVIVLSLYISLVSILISFWAVDVSLFACSIGGIVSGGVFVITGNTYAGVGMFGVALFLIGASLYAFFGCKYATKGIVILTKKIGLYIKGLFINKGEV